MATQSGTADTTLFTADSTQFTADATFYDDGQVDPPPAPVVGLSASPLTGRTAFSGALTGRTAIASALSGEPI